MSIFFLNINIRRYLVLVDKNSRDIDFRKDYSIINGRSNIKQFIHFKPKSISKIYMIYFYKSQHCTLEFTYTCAHNLLASAQCLDGRCLLLILFITYYLMANTNTLYTCGQNIIRLSPDSYCFIIVRDIILSNR